MATTRYSAIEPSFGHSALRKLSLAAQLPAVLLPAQQRARVLRWAVVISMSALPLTLALGWYSAKFSAPKDEVGASLAPMHQNRCPPPDGTEGPEPSQNGSPQPAAPMLPMMVPADDEDSLRIDELHPGSSTDEASLSPAAAGRSLKVARVKPRRTPATLQAATQPRGEDLANRVVHSEFRPADSADFACAMLSSGGPAPHGLCGAARFEAASPRSGTAYHRLLQDIMDGAQALHDRGGSGHCDVPRDDAVEHKPYFELRWPEAEQAHGHPFRVLLRSPTRGGATLELAHVAGDGLRNTGLFCARSPDDDADPRCIRRLQKLSELLTWTAQHCGE